MTKQMQKVQEALNHKKTAQPTPAPTTTGHKAKLEDMEMEKELAQEQAAQAQLNNQPQAQGTDLLDNVSQAVGSLADALEKAISKGNKGLEKTHYAGIRG